MNSLRSSNRLLAAVIGLLTLATIACGTKTQLSNVWRAQGYSGGPMKKVLVVGIAETSTGRRSFESQFVRALAARNVDAMPSYELLPSDDRLTEGALKAAIRGHEFDGVIGTRLIGVDEEKTDVPPSTYVSPSPYGHRGFYGYYGRSWDVVHTPGYTLTTTVVRLETQLYDARSAELVWGVQSNTFDPKTKDDIIESVTTRISEQLSAEGLIPR